MPDVVALAIQDRGMDAEHWSVDFWIDDIDSAVERVADRRPAGAIFTISQLMSKPLVSAGATSGKR